MFLVPYLPLEKPDFSVPLRPAMIANCRTTMYPGPAAVFNIRQRVLEPKAALRRLAPFTAANPCQLSALTLAVIKQ